MPRVTIWQRMSITTVSSLILLTGAFFGHFSSFWSTATPSSGVSMLPIFSQHVCIYLRLLSSLHDWLWSSPLLDINIPIFTVLYFGYKIIMRTKIWKPTEMDFVTVSLDLDDDHEFLIDDLPFFSFFSGHPFWSWNRTTSDPTKEHLGAYWGHPFLSKSCVLLIQW